MTPAEALRDPELPFNLEVMRGALKARQVARDTARAAAPGSIEIPNLEDES